jgi:hypothetical protein
MLCDLVLKSLNENAVLIAMSSPIKSHSDLPHWSLYDEEIAVVRGACVRHRKAACRPRGPTASNLARVAGDPSVHSRSGGSEAALFWAFVGISIAWCVWITLKNALRIFS